jgi:hypothetical protein
MALKFWIGCVFKLMIHIMSYGVIDAQLMIYMGFIDSLVTLVNRQ